MRDQHPDTEPAQFKQDKGSSQTPVSVEHPMMTAWKEWCDGDEFKTALRWAVETKYDDGRPVDDIQREQHAKGAMWLAFTKGMEHRDNVAGCCKAPVGWKCTRELDHDGPCAAVSIYDDYVAWLRYVRTGDSPTRIVVCDSDSEGAFKVYRR